MPEEINDRNFEDRTSGNTCVVLFYKDPCPYCKTMKGVMEKFGKKNQQVTLLQINGLENPHSTAAHGVERFPDLIFFKNGQEAARQKGLTNPQGLAKLYKSI